MNMNKTILATLISTAFSSSVIAQSVNIELANLETEKVIQSQMDSIDSATLAKLNAQNSKVVALNGVVYEQDESGVWKAIGTGALGLTAALFSGSSSSASNKLSDTRNYEQGAIKPSVDNKPGLPDVDNDIPRDINLITHGDTAYMYVNGEEVRSATLDVTSEGNYTITGSEGAMFHVTSNDVGKDVLVTMVNGESVKFHNVNRTDDRNISFSVEGENYNLHRTYSGEVWVQKEQGNGTGNWATIKTGADVLANIQERQLINVIDKTLPDVDNSPIKPEVDNKPGLPDVDNDIPRDINLITHGDTAYMYVNGEEVRTATLDVTSKDNFTITGSEGATFHVTGKDVLVTMVNGESVKLHNVNRTDDRNISFSVEGENYNLHRTYSGEVWVQKEQGNGTGNWATVKTGADVLANIQERQLINAIDKTLPEVDNSPILPNIDGGEGSQELKIVDGGIFLGGEKIGFIASDGNVNLYEKGKIGSVTATSGGGNVSQITLNGGQTIDIARNQGNAMETTITANNGSKIVIDHSDGSITTVKPRPEVDKPEFELPSFERVNLGEIEVDEDNQAIKVNGEWFYATVGDEFVTINGKRILLSKDERNNITLHSAQGDLLATVHTAKIIGGKVRLVEHADSSRTYIGEQGLTITIDANKKKALQAKASKIKAKVKLSK